MVARVEFDLSTGFTSCHKFAYINIHFRPDETVTCTQKGFCNTQVCRRWRGMNTLENRGYQSTGNHKAQSGN